MNNSRIWAAALFAATALVAGLATTTGARPQVADGSIQGIVVDAETGTPLQGVQVQLRGAAYIAATTGTDGAFRLEGLSPGRYRLTTVSETHAPVRNPRHRLQGHSELNLTVGRESISGLTLRLARWGIATGTVVDAQGQPIPGALVAAARRGYSEKGDAEFQIPQGTQLPQATNDRGQFRFFRLEEAEYYFAVEPPTSLPTRPPDVNFHPVLYPGVSDPNQAVPVSISAGQESQLSTIIVSSRTAPSGGLRIINETGETLRNRTVTLRSVLWNRVVSSTLSGSSDPPGLSTLAVHTLMMGVHDVVVSWETDRGLVSGTARIDPAPASESDLVVRPGGMVSGVLIAERGSDTEPLGSVECRLVAEAPMPGRSVSSLLVRTDENGRFRSATIPPGRYRIGCPGLPAGMYIAAVFQDGRDVLREGFPADSQVELRVVARPGTIVSGRVVDSAGDTVADAVVALIPEDAFSAESAFIRSGTTDQMGSFELEAVPAGSYRLFAWRELPGAAYRNTEFMQPYRQLGKVIELSEPLQRREELISVLER